MIFDSVKAYRITVLKFRSYIEILIAILCSVTWLLGWCAPIFPIIYIQFMRVKYVTSYFTKTSFDDFNDCLLKPYLPSFLYNLIDSSVKPYLRTFAKMEEDQ